MVGSEWSVVSKGCLPRPFILSDRKRCREYANRLGERRVGFLIAKPELSNDELGSSGFQGIEMELGSWSFRGLVPKLEFRN